MIPTTYKIMEGDQQGIQQSHIVLDSEKASRWDTVGSAATKTRHQQTNCSVCELKSLYEHPIQRTDSAGISWAAYVMDVAWLVFLGVGGTDSAQIHHFCTGTARSIQSQQRRCCSLLKEHPIYRSAWRLRAL